LKSLPNLLTAVRLLAAPYLGYLLWLRDYRTALWALLLAGLTDVADGGLARFLKTPSRFGEVLDPIADKVLMGVVFFTLAWTRAIELWLVIIVIGRDVIILLVAGVAWATGNPTRRFPPSVWGKLSTFLQIAFVMFRMGALAGIVSAGPADALKWAVAAMALWSGGDYALKAMRHNNS
jgi:cardiolipin synthase